MRCGSCRDHLSSLVDGELAEGKRKQVEAHVAACAMCAAELDELRDLRAGLAGLGADFSGEPAPAPTDDMPLDAEGFEALWAVTENDAAPGPDAADASDESPRETEHDPIWAQIEKGLDEDDRKARIEARRPTRRFPWLMPAAATSLVLSAVGGFAAVKVVKEQTAAHALDEAMLGQARQAIGDARAEYEKAAAELDQIAAADRAAWPSDERDRFDERARLARRKVELRVQSLRHARRPDLVDELALDEAIRQQIQAVSQSVVKGVPAALGTGGVGGSGGIDDQRDDVSPAALRGSAW